MIKKYKLTTNLSLKIVAFVFAAFLWLIVANVDNPVVRNTYANIPVTIVNEDVITQGGEVYSVLDEQNVNVVVYAKRSVIQQISSDEIVATADIKEMDAHTGLIPIKITIPSHSGEYQSAEASPRNIQIKTEKTGKAVFTLSVSATGVPRDGYMTGEMKVNPEKITITGAESKISQIKKAEAKINVDGLSKDTEVEAELVLYDAAENVISQSQLSNNLGSEGITVDVEVLQKKSVPVQFSVSGEPAEGYRYGRAVSELEGAFSLAIITSHAPDCVFAARKDSSLAIGFGKGCSFVSSDIPAISGFAERKAERDTRKLAFGQQRFVRGRVRRCFLFLELPRCKLCNHHAGTGKHDR